MNLVKKSGLLRRHGFDIQRFADDLMTLNAESRRVVKQNALAVGINTDLRDHFERDAYRIVAMEPPATMRNRQFQTEGVTYDIEFLMHDSTPIFFRDTPIHFAMAYLNYRTTNVGDWVHLDLHLKPIYAKGPSSER